MDDALLVRRFERLRDLTRHRECLLNRQRTERQTLAERRAFHEFEHEAADAFGLLESIDRANVRVVQRRQHPRLAFEARDPLRVCKEDVCHDLDGDITAQLRIAGPIHVAHPARAEERKNPMRTELPARERRAVIGSQDVRRRFANRRFEKPLRCVRVREQRLHLPSQRFVVTACRRHERGALANVADKRSVAQVFDTPPALGVCHRPSPSSSRSNQSFANRQSRLTVSGETWSTSDVSSTLKPPKKRSSITRLFRTSTAASASKARSSATTSSAGSGEVTSPSSSVTRGRYPSRSRASEVSASVW